MATRKKSVGKASAKNGCVLCKRSTEDEPDFGGLLSTKSIQAHHFCLLLSETISQTGQDNQGIWGFLNSDILQEVKNSKTKQCHYCNEFGATLGCNRKNCKRKFHLPCGLMNRTQHDYDNFVSYCHAHRKVNNLPTKIRHNISDYKCLICLENYNARRVNLEHLVWADCCKKDVVLHIACVKRLALSAGYFTKCPACNNNQEFISTIKKYGVFVPERDASWELDRNAFGDLLYRHSKCDAVNCISPRGREYKGAGNWKIILCRLCGSFGSHKGCTDVKDAFVCQACDINQEQEKTNSSTVISKGEKTIQINDERSSSSSNNDDSAALPEQNIIANEKSSTYLEIINISSDSDDHFSESEPETYAPPTSVKASSSSTRKRKLDYPSTVPQVAKKKTVYSQSRNVRYEHQVARKSTGGNKIYCSLLPQKIESKASIMDNKNNIGIDQLKFSSLNCNSKRKCEEPEGTDLKTTKLESSLHNVPYNNSQHVDIKNIASIKNMINTTLDTPSCFQFFCSGPLILQCSSEIDAVEIDNNNEVEIVNLPEGIIAQKNIPLPNPKITETVVIGDSDDENMSDLKISDVCSLSDKEKDCDSNFKDEERLSTSGIFENRIRSTIKDIFIRSRSQHKFNYCQRVQKIVKIDFKSIDYKDSQWCLPMPR